MPVETLVSKLVELKFRQDETIMEQLGSRRNQAEKHFISLISVAGLLSFGKKVFLRMLQNRQLLVRKKCNNDEKVVVVAVFNALKMLLPPLLNSLVLNRLDEKVRVVVVENKNSVV